MNAASVAQVDRAIFDSIEVTKIKIRLPFLNSNLQLSISTVLLSQTTKASKLNNNNGTIREAIAMARKKRNGVAKGVPGRARAEKERKELEAKEHQLRVLCIRLQALIADARDTGITAPPSPEAVAAIFKELRQLALAPRGFVSDAFRQQLWLFLVGRAGFESLEKRDPAHFAARCKDPHRDDSQVEKDIERSLWCVCVCVSADTSVKVIACNAWRTDIVLLAMHGGHRHYDTLRGIRESERRTKRRALTQIIGAVLRANEQLHYYQV